MTSHETVDFARAKYIILFGRDLIGSLQNRETQDLIEGISHGAKLIYFDPRYSLTSIKAHEWWPIRPGTDLALMLAMINVLLEEERFNVDFVREYTHGIDALYAHVRQYSPEWAAKECDVPADVIRRIAREFGDAAPAAVIHPGRRVTRYGQDTQTMRAVAILNAMAGNWGQPCGIFLKSQVYVRNYPIPEFPKPARPRVDGAAVKDQVPLAFPDEGLTNQMRAATLSEKPYPIKAWINYGSNIFTHTADIELTKKAIEKLDFIATIEVLPTSIAWWSDVILTEASYLERYDDLQVQGDYNPFFA